MSADERWEVDGLALAVGVGGQFSLARHRRLADVHEVEAERVQRRARMRGAVTDEDVEVVRRALGWAEALRQECSG